MLDNTIAYSVRISEILNELHKSDTAAEKPADETEQDAKAGKE